MANDAARCAFVTTNEDTNLVILFDKHDTVLSLKDKISKQHQECFPIVGKIAVSVVKVNLVNELYHLPDSMFLSQAFEAISNTDDSFLSVDVMRVEDKAAPTATENLPSDEMYQATVAENQAPLGRLDATSEPMHIDAEIGGKDNVDKAEGEEVKFVKRKKKTMKAKAQAIEVAQVASSSQIVESAAEDIEEGTPENLDNLVKKIVEEA
ncbi:uncharacterized protein LOC111832463 [Capsella rubella]|uniref:uncharacterized protein LOC111832463 n=1 Tax=Capsella rubella TaxID=81985 RepID=UPI000CD50529|nr:uncharacterized protein LOC111832463 [Capsella rubella]